MAECKKQHPKKQLKKKNWWGLGEEEIQEMGMEGTGVMRRKSSETDNGLIWRSHRILTGKQWSEELDRRLKPNFGKPTIIGLFELELSMNWRCSDNF